MTVSSAGQGSRARASEPRIVTPQEARAWGTPIGRLFRDEEMIEQRHRLAHTVATEPDRTRAAVVEALLHFADAYGDVDAAAIAQNIKDGGEW